MKVKVNVKHDQHLILILICHVQTILGYNPEQMKYSPLCCLLFLNHVCIWSFAGSARDKSERAAKTLHKLQLLRIEPAGQLWAGSVTAAAVGAVRSEQVSTLAHLPAGTGCKRLANKSFYLLVPVPSAISGGGGGGWDQLYRAPEMKRQIRYRQCYFNPISCFKK